MSDPKDKIKILVLEKDSKRYSEIRGMIVRQALGKMSAHRGIVDVVWAESMKGALARISTDKFNMILTGLSLGELPVSEILPQIREHNTQVPVVILASAEEEKVAQKMVDQGASAYLINGRYDAEKVLALVDKHIKQETEKPTIVSASQVLNKDISEIPVLNILQTDIHLVNRMRGDVRDNINELIYLARKLCTAPVSLQEAKVIGEDIRRSGEVLKGLLLTEVVKSTNEAKSQEGKTNGTPAAQP